MPDERDYGIVLRIYGIRNVIAHAYVIVDKRTIWETAEKDIPDLRERLTASLDNKN